MAANPNKGEVALEIGGTSYTLKFSSNALCVAEKVSGLSIGGLMTGLDNRSLNAVRSLFLASLSKQLPDYTLEQAGDLMDEAGVSRVTDALMEALLIAFPKTKAGAENPTKPGQVGTG